MHVLISVALRAWSNYIDSMRKTNTQIDVTLYKDVRKWEWNFKIQSSWATKEERDTFSNMKNEKWKMKKWAVEEKGVTSLNFLFLLWGSIFFFLLDRPNLKFWSLQTWSYFQFKNDLWILLGSSQWSSLYEMLYASNFMFAAIRCLI